MIDLFWHCYNQTFLIHWWSNNHLVSWWSVFSDMLQLGLMSKLFKVNLNDSGRARAVHPCARAHVKYALCQCFELNMIDRYVAHTRSWEFEKWEITLQGQSCVYVVNGTRYSTVQSNMGQQGEWVVCTALDFHVVLMGFLWVLRKP